jgi:hypothetical protein
VRVVDVTTPGAMWGEGTIHAGTVHYGIGFGVAERGTFQGAVLQVEAEDDRFPHKDADRFRARSADFVAFSDDPAVHPGVARIDTVLFSGAGDWNGHTGYRYQMSVVDKGEPGHPAMFVRLTITDASGAVVVQVEGAFDNGINPGVSTQARASTQTRGNWQTGMHRR